MNDVCSLINNQYDTHIKRNIVSEIWSGKRKLLSFDLISEKEYNDIISFKREKIGGNRTISDEIIEEIIDLKLQGLTQNEICEQYSLSKYIVNKIYNDKMAPMKK